MIASSLLALVVFFHGGGFTQGNKTHIVFKDEWLALLGKQVAIASVGYPLLGDRSGTDAIGPADYDKIVRESATSPAALAFPAAGASAGLRFDPAAGFGSIWREVDVGTAPCELSCEVELTRGQAESLR